MDEASISKSRSSSSATHERTPHPAIVLGGCPLFRTALLFAVLLLLIAPGTLPDTALSVDWEDGGVCVLSVSLSDAADASGGVWVVTLKADRYEDGVFAWQLHWSPEQANVIVLPNDFLTSRAFTPDQLGIIAELGDEAWTLRIPRSEAIPQLIAPGDTLRIHALWIQQEPLGSVTVPEATVAAAAIAGAGGGQPAAPPETQVAVPAGTPSNEPLPLQNVYVAGEPILHRFIPVDPETGLARIGVHATATLLRVFKDKPPDLLIYKILQPDGHGALDLRIETTDLASGTYELFVWISGEEHAHSMRLELMTTNP